MQYTSAFQLSQWEADDPILRSDFNSDNLKIATALARCGNCHIAFGSYEGTGTAGVSDPNTLVFDFCPLLVILNTAVTASTGNDHTERILLHPCAQVKVSGVSAYNYITWGENSVSWYTTSTHSDRAIYQFNGSTRTYHYIAIGI